jgi:hypothetical protein
MPPKAVVITPLTAVITLRIGRDTSISNNNSQVVNNIILKNRLNDIGI